MAFLYLKHREQARAKGVEMAPRSTHIKSRALTLSADGKFAPKDLGTEKCKNTQEQKEQD